MVTSGSEWGLFLALQVFLLTSVFSLGTTVQPTTRGTNIPFLPFSFLLGPPGTTLRPWRDAKLDRATPSMLPSRPGSPDQMLRGHPGLPKPPTSEQPAFPPCPGEKGQVAPAEAPIILSSPRTSKTDSYELVWRPRHEGGGRAPILYYVVKHRKVWCLALCRPLGPGRAFCLLAISLEFLRPGPAVPTADLDLLSSVTALSYHPPGRHL